MSRLRWAAVAALAVQAVLLFSNLGLLPLWGDEWFTLRAVREPLPQMFETLRNDIHPPLYFLAGRVWMQIPLADDPVVRLRMLSAVFALSASAYALWFFLPRLTPAGGLWFSALLALSPCFVLYGRMGRSYSLQVLVTLAGIHALLQYLKRPAHGRAVALGIAAALVLYTHYLPGVALLAAANIVILLRTRAPGLLILPNVVMLAAYSPWLISSLGAARAWGATGRAYFVTGGSITEQVVKLGYWAMSFLFGESIPWWLFAVEIPLGAALAWIAWSGRAKVREWGLLVLILTVIGYLGVSRWASYPFVPARLLFLLPFVLALLAHGAEARPAAARFILGGMLAASGLGLWSYYRVESYLNWGYAIPFDRVARDAGQCEKVVALLTDSGALAHYLPPQISFQSIGVSRNPEEAVAALAASKRVCVVRQMHDSSGNGFYDRFDAALAATYPFRRQHSYLPFTRLDTLLITALGWKDRPAYFYEMVELSPQPY